MVKTYLRGTHVATADTIVEVKRPASPDEITQWRDGYAWLGGGTWLFSEPQWATDTLIDLDQFRWPSLQASSVGLEIAATGRIVELYRFDGPAEWTAAPLFRLCCDSLLGSFKIWNAPGGPVGTAFTRDAGSPEKLSNNHGT